MIYTLMTFKITLCMLWTNQFVTSISCNWHGGGEFDSQNAWGFGEGGLKLQIDRLHTHIRRMYGKCQLKSTALAAQIVLKSPTNQPKDIRKTLKRVSEHFYCISVLYYSGHLHNCPYILLMWSSYDKDHITFFLCPPLALATYASQFWIFCWLYLNFHCVCLM